MIPPGFDPTTTSPGEVEVFLRLRDDPGASDWTVLHSLDLPEHGRQISGEMDFLIVVPHQGVLCLEVKSHRHVSRLADGTWLVGNDPPSFRGPFKQAAEAMHAVRKELGEREPSLRSVLFCAGVCFPFLNFSLASPAEWFAWQVLDSSALRARPISQSIASMIASAREHVSRAGTASWFDPAADTPTTDEADVLARALRPAFEAFESPRARREARAQELRKYTEEQFDALDAMEANDRVLFEGAAGTGKTLLALEAARRSASDAIPALFCCFNRLLAGWLQQECQPLAEHVKVQTFHSLLLALAPSTEVPEAGPSDFWERLLPDAALDHLLDGAAAAPFGRLIVDEAQDLLRPQYLDVLDLLVEGGLASGSWRIFGDFERQAIYGFDGPAPARSLLSRVDSVPTFRLTANCRNTPRIAAQVSLVTGLPPYQRILRPDNGVEPELRFLRHGDSAGEALTSILEMLKREGFAGDEVVVLSRRNKDSAAETISTEPWRSRLRPLGSLARGHVRFGSIHAYKGLEAAAVVVTDIDAVGTPESDALMYVAMTRATDRLVVIASEDVKRDLQRRLVGYPDVG
jgi:hypothetical protein